MSKEIKCACGFDGKAKKKFPGSGVLEILLWLFGLIPVILMLIEPLPIYFIWTPVLCAAVIYTIWRQAKAKFVCPKCGEESS